MVMLGRSVNLAIQLLSSLRPSKAVNHYFVHILAPETGKCPFRISGRRNESMWPDRVSNPGHLVFEQDVLLTA